MANSQTMKIIIQARDEAKKTLDRLNKSLKGVEKHSKDAEKGISKFGLSLSSLKNSIFSLKGAVIGMIGAFGLWKIYSYVKGSVLMAARFKTLGVTLETLGKKAGYSVDKLAEYEKGLRKTGIAAIETRTILARMIQSQLKLGKATDLARVAQNAAVIAGLNSSDTFQRMIHSIQANSVEILRTIGMNVSFERSYKTFAKTLDISVSQMTEAQKVQARFNAVLKGGAQIAGAYEAAMTTAGKSMLSFQRYVDDFRVTLGKSFEPVLAVVVKQATTAMKEFTAAIDEESFQKGLKEFADIMGKEVKGAFQWLINNKEQILSTIAGITKATGLAVRGLSAILSVFDVDQARALKQMNQMLDIWESQLDTFSKKRAKLVEKLADPGWHLFSNDRMKREIAEIDKQMNVLGAKIKKQQLAIIEGTPAIPSPFGEEQRRKAISDFLLYQKKLTAAQAQTKQKPTALGSSLLASAFKRSVVDIEFELANLKSHYDKNLISTQKYYSEKVRLTKEAFKAEEEYLKSQIGKEKDPDKQLKIEDKLYSARKKFETRLIRLSNERLVAEKGLASERLNIEKTLQSARIALLSKSASLSDFEKSETEKLKVAQDERLRDLKNAKASRDQLRENEIISERENQQLSEEQLKKSEERKRNIRRGLAERAEALIDPNSLYEVFAAEMAALERQQSDKLRSIVDSTLREKAKLAAIEDHHRLSQLEKEKLAVQQRLKVQELYFQGTKESLSNLNSLFGDLYELSNQKSKEFFYAQKAIAIAQTIISTYEGAQHAFTSYAKTSPILAYAAAATAIAAGLARVAVIRAQSLAAGGEVKGRSVTKTSDNIPIMATAKEFVQPVSAVEYYGKGVMEAMRKKLIPPELFSGIARNIYIPSKPKYSYATGGEVSGISRKMSPSVIINLENNTGENIEVEEEGTTFDGEKVITDLVLKKFMTSRDYRQAFRGR